MKISEFTGEIIKNFSTINVGLVFTPNKKLRTITTTKSIYAEAEIDEEFPKEFGIYDLSKFLSILSIKRDCDVQIEDECVSFADGGSKIRIRFSPINLINSPPNKEISIPLSDIKFAMTKETLIWISKVSSILKCPTIVVKGRADGTMAIFVKDSKGAIVDDASIEVDGHTNIEFEAVLRVDNLKVILGTYDVQVSYDTKKNKAIFLKLSYMEGRKLNYWIAFEDNT